jgi:hypothetical protein
MLSVDRATLKAGESIRLCVLELDAEHGRVLVDGWEDVLYALSGKRGPELQSGATGCRYAEPEMFGEVEMWGAGDRGLAIFADEASMRAGGLELVKLAGERMPVGIYRVLTAQGEPLEAGQ